MRPVGAQSLKKMKEEKAEKAPAPPKRKRASFRRGKLRKGKARKGKARKSKARESKAGEKLGDDEKAGDGKVTMYASYNLLELNIPDEARPVTLGKGSHSYTLKNADCTASIEAIFKLVAMVMQIEDLPWAGRHAIAHDVSYNEHTMNILGSMDRKILEKLPDFRFGAALSSLRTQNDRDIKRQAWEDLAHALQQPLRLPGDCKISRKWVKKGGLQRVFAFLRRQH
ncbi:hypothetical protein AK812_SmicGene12702 [Symbiodinium microadriaticum]|uniref:Uncharacterized protein n=1 Tax=Symbiodinium microadriaticum TaxID=2951 RepID=A0A1Q9E9X0_SYMMI|nr:hypothetical protein AK812_SmicGene12702 [Symbiodinium microadriaticum]CAE7419958.1 unnamed protein product [Symbiodinium microadriaticum]CAE7563712.1 unnamed protein product [Symbiodinium sp. KB8]